MKSGHLFVIQIKLFFEKSIVNPSVFADLLSKSDPPELFRSMSGYEQRTL